MEHVLQKNAPDWAVSKLTNFYQNLLIFTNILSVYQKIQEDLKLTEQSVYTFYPYLNKLY